MQNWSTTAINSESTTLEPTASNARFLQFLRPAMRLKYAVVASAMALLALLVPEAVSQTSRTIRVVIPFPARGGAAEILVRALADEIAHAHSVTTVIENRPGAGALIGTESVARAAPDGNTLLITANSFVISPSLRKLTFDPLTSFEPICHLAITPMFFVVSARSPYRNLAELFDAARAKPGELTLASLGPATAQHMAWELLKRRAGVEMSFVPYPSNMPALVALLGGHVVSALANYPDVVQQIKAGEMRALATTSLTRSADLPEVPTVTELGFSGYEANVWQGLVAPAKTPPARISEISNWLTTALAVPSVASKLAAQGIFPKAFCGAEFGAYLRAQHDEYARVIREAGIKME
jgi:tripartite-type tricarboxylate transporter receptor subunit TctC